MAAPKKTNQHTVLSLEKRIRLLEDLNDNLVIQVGELEEKIDRIIQGKTKSEPRQEQSIQHVESFNQEEIPNPEGRKLVMTDADKLRSMQNAIKILPPNYLDENGRHSKTNIGAICGFEVTAEMMDDVYKNVEHRNGFLIDKDTGQRIQ